MAALILTEFVRVKKQMDAAMFIDEAIGLKRQGPRG
jgi:hypothetical protein